MTKTKTHSIPTGSTVLLPDGTKGTAYRNGETYTVVQGQRRDIGWRPEQLRLAR